MLAAGREIVEGLFLLTKFGECNPETTRLLTRTTLVGLVYAVALAVPNFNDLVNLVGGLANCLMGLVLPPVLWQVSLTRVIATKGTYSSEVFFATNGIYRKNRE